MGPSTQEACLNRRSPRRGDTKNQISGLTSPNRNKRVSVYGTEKDIRNLEAERQTKTGREKVRFLEAQNFPEPQKRLERIL